MKRNIHNIEANQNGMVSFLICMIMLIVITLVVFGFSQISRNESTQTLNRQLSTEAFYAADSGINNAAAVVTNAGAAAVNESTCGVGGVDPYITNAQLNSTIVAYTCVTVNTHPTSLGYDVPTGQASAFPVDTGTGNPPVSSITFSWNDGSADYTSCPASSGPFPSSASWSTTGNPCDAAVLQVDMIAASNTTSAAGLDNDADTIYLYPTQRAASSGTFANDSVYDASCSAGNLCNATVSGFAPEQVYYLRVTSVYTDSYLKVCANSGTACSVPLYNAQADVDSTGRARNVLQRLDARVSMSQLSGSAPINAIQTGDSLCKLITGYPPANGNPGLAEVGVLPGGIPGADIADNLGCSLN